MSVRLGAIADIHGNDVALRAVLADAGRFGVERWWALGDLVLFGPRPAEVLQILRELPGIGMLRGNTDRYVLTGEQPAPHETVADAAGSIDLVRRYAGMAAGIGWTRGVLDQAGLLGVLDDLPAQLRLRLPGGASVLGVHASPRADDGQGIEPGIADEELGPLLAGADAEVVIGGHTHAATDRVVGGVRALNPGSTGLPRRSGIASWLLLGDDGDGLTVTIRDVPFDAEAVVADLRRRRHPQTEFVSSVLAGLLGAGDAVEPVAEEGALGGLCPPGYPLAYPVRHALPGRSCAEPHAPRKFSRTTGVLLGPRLWNPMGPSSPACLARSRW